MSWSWVDTEYSIHRVQHTPSTQDWLFSLHSHDYELTPECSFSFRRAFQYDWPPSASSAWEPKDKVTLSHCHSCRLTNGRIVSQYPVTVQRPPRSPHPNSLDYGLHVRLITASKCLSKVAQLRPPISLNRGLQVHLQTRSITASKCIIKLARLRPASSHNHGHEVHISKLTQLRPPSVSPNSLDYGFHKRISILPLSRSRSASPSPLNHGLLVYLQIRSTTTSKCISNAAWSWPRSVALSLLILIFWHTLNSSEAPPAAIPDIPCVDR